MRGDRPHCSMGPYATSRATPHARGSTSRSRLSLLASTGYPACAGIDPSALTDQTRVMGLPRMRGDRPFVCACSISWRRATPHARGSTVHRRRWPGRTHGYPACAGIDPSALTDQTRVMGLPRMRGDRPDAVFAWDPCSAATPHARGSTSTVSPRIPQRIGYPACAGIDPIFMGGRESY